MDALTARRLTLLGTAFHNINLGQAVFAILARRPGLPFTYIVTPNADHLRRLGQIGPLRVLYEAAWLCLLDSRAIAHAASWLGHAVPPVVTGADLTAALLARVAGQRVAVVGMAPAVMRALIARYPGVQFLHHDAPMRLLDNDAALLAAQLFIETAQADFTFLACGSPAQELLAHRTALAGRATGMGLCIGGALEFCAGTRPRAPLWLRRRGLEWAWRLGCEPQRLAARYLLHDPPVFFRLIGACFRRT
jgi:N-acetylglucosaminyldiphosphoundecaprenol N-acetyl-beta-D-mannosaminyltransferase